MLKVDRADAHRLRHWLPRSYQAGVAQDDHFVWSHGLPFFGEFLRKSLPILRAASSEPEVKAWCQRLREDLDKTAQAMLDAHIRGLSDVNSAR